MVVLGLLDVVVVAVVVGQFGPGWQTKHPASFHSLPEVSATKPAFSIVTVEKEHALPETWLLNAKALQLGSWEQISAQSSGLLWFGYTLVLYA